VAIAPVARTPSTEPVVITTRGPRRSISRPTTMPAPAETSAPTENAPVAAPIDHPVSALIAPTSTGNA
jgi:hypothetical protein